jgi:hypothetical protein
MRVHGAAGEQEQMVRFFMEGLVHVLRQRAGCNDAK